VKARIDLKRSLTSTATSANIIVKIEKR